MITNGTYQYSFSLLALNSFIQPVWRTSSLLSLEAFSLLNQTQWIQHLTSYSDEFSTYILEGIKSGFRIGFDRAQPLQSAATNLHSNNPSVISEYLAREVSLHRMWKYPCHCSPLVTIVGAIPKKNKPGKWRLIVDLSSPKGFSINDGISPELLSMSYVCVPGSPSISSHLSWGGALLVKADTKKAYHKIPIHLNDQHLLGIHWEDSIYMDRMLLFGLHSAPKISLAIADTLQWILI